MAGAVNRLMAVVALLIAGALPRASAQQRPNIVLIYTDDLGYGDLSSYGATALNTPNIDRLAKEGLRFTDGHAAAATCTPSRYALMTGEYAWRRPGTGVLPGDAALIIDPDRTTLASLLRNAGYATGIVGKWHLGLGSKGGPDWNHDVAPGPNEIGFDYSFIMPATGDRVPTVYVENRRVVGLDPADPIRVSYDEPLGGPTGSANPDLLKLRPSHGHDQTIVNGISRIGYMTGGRAALWKDEDMALVFTGKATAFIEQHRDQPFFLYFAPHDPHVPRVPNPRFAGRTTLGPRGDVIVQADWSVGELLTTLDRLKLTNNTLLIFTSDNGPVIDDGYRDEAVEKLGAHRLAGPFRGGKYSNFEAGTRVPLIVRWPGHVKPGSSSDALVAHIDFVASFAQLTGRRLPGGEAPDSEKLLSVLLGRSKQGRDSFVEQGSGLSLRQGRWKYIEPSARPRLNAQTNTELGNDTAAQLYDLAADPGEHANVAAKYPDRVKAMETLLRRVKERSRPGRYASPRLAAIHSLSSFRKLRSGV